MLNSVGRMSRDEIGVLLCLKVLMGSINQFFDIKNITEVPEALVLVNRGKSSVCPLCFPFWFSDCH